MTACTTTPFLANPVWDIVPGGGILAPQLYTLNVWTPTDRRGIDLPTLAVYGLSREDLIALRATIDAALGADVRPDHVRTP